MASCATYLRTLILLGLLCMVMADVASEASDSCPSCSCMSEIESLSQRMYEQDERIICLQNALDEMQSEAAATTNVWGMSTSIHSQTCPS